MATNTNTGHSVFHPNSLFIRTALPLTLLMAVFIGAGVYIGRETSRALYHHLSQETLRHDAFFVRALLSDHQRRQTDTADDLTQAQLRERVVASAAEQAIVLMGRPSLGLLLLDEQGKTLFNTRSDKPMGTNINIRSVLENTTTFVLTAINPDGTTLAHTYFQPLGVHIVAFNTQRFEQAPFYRGLVGATTVMVSLLTVLLLVLTYVLLNLFVLRPVKQLSATMREIVTKDDFNQNLPIGGSNELAQVARLFNTLLHHLRDREAKLRDHRERLEDLVAARTQDLLTVQAKLVQQERLAAIGEFSSSIAHELRNPLTSIKMGIEQIRPNLTSLDAKNTRRMELVEAEITRLDSMLKGILAFAASTPTQVEPLPLKEILAQAHPTFEALAKDNGHRLEAIGLNLDRSVLADKNKLLQALINLVKNACEAHTGAAPVRVTASSTASHVTLQVQNGGKPIPPEVMDRLFEPFFTTKTSGTGLGLPTTKRLVEEMGGTITLESTPALGTIATITLPLAEPAL
jgi:signal transduction histidine kinase